MKKNLILVGMIESPHFQKWINVTISTKLFSKIIVLPSDYPSNKIDFKSLVSDKKQRTKVIIFKLPFGRKINNFTFQALDLIFGLNWRALILFILIRIYHPTFVHFHELQHGGYIYNAKIFDSARTRKYKVICSTWGSDLILYGKLSSHELQLKKLLSNTDVLTAERVDEKAIAEKLNYSNSFFAPMYITVGMKVESRVPSSKPSNRKMILIKGYQDNHGRALNALAALTVVERHLSDYKIAVFSASAVVAQQVDYLQNNSSLNIEVIKHSTNEVIKDYFSHSRIYIGLSISDGLPSSMVEAMEQGAFPIQSQNSAASSFIKDGITGYIVDPWDITSIANCIENAVKNDQMVNMAAIENINTIKEKYNYVIGLNRVKELYNF
jgi:glycosyltransferase involved in cell wall biosynthesis